MINFYWQRVLKPQADLHGDQKKIKKQDVPEFTRMLSDWDPFSDEPAGWFDSEWMFGISNGFDVVIGNPPYGFRTVLTKEEKDYFRKVKKIEFSSGDSAELFCKISFNQLIKEKGILTFIIPKKSLYGDAWEDMRVNYWKKFDLAFILDTGKSFDNVLLEASVFGLIKNDTNRKVELAFLENDLTIQRYSNTDKKHLFLENNTCQIYKVLYPVQIFEKIKRNSFATKKIKTQLGLAIGQEYFSDTKTKYKLLKGIDVERYNIRSHRYLRNYENLKRENVEVFLRPKVISQRIVAHIENPTPHLKITACYDSEGIAITNTLMAFFPDKDIPVKFLLSYLNSKFVSWYAYNFIYARAVRTMDFYDYYIQQLPVLKTTGKNQSIIAQIIDYIILLKKNSKDFFFFESLINAMVYELYFPEEIRAASAEMLKHLTNLPELKDDLSDEKKLTVIEKVYKELSDLKHPVSVAMSKMQNVKEVKIVEGKA